VNKTSMFVFAPTAIDLKSKSVSPFGGTGSQGRRREGVGVDSLIFFHISLDASFS